MNGLFQRLAASNTINAIPPATAPIQRLSRILAAKLHRPESGQLAVTLTVSEARQIYMALAEGEA